MPRRPDVNQLTQSRVFPVTLLYLESHVLHCTFEPCHNLNMLKLNEKTSVKKKKEDKHRERNTGGSTLSREEFWALSKITYSLCVHFVLGDYLLCSSAK